VSQEPGASARASRFVPSVAAATAVAAALRCAGLSRQVLGGDEVHAIRYAAASGLGEILTTYPEADNSIPLTALYHLWFRMGFTPSELELRLPVLLCGVALVPLLPVLMRREVGDRTAQILAWLLAVSPALVLYSRIVRSYLPVVLLASLAAIAFAAWMRSRSSRTAAVYVALAAASVFFHLGAGPFVLAPFVYAAAAAVVRPGSTPGPVALARLFAATAAALGLFLIPAWDTLGPLIASVRQTASIGLDTLTGFARLQAGTPSAPLAAGFYAVAILGAAGLARRRPPLAAYTAILVAGQIVGILLLSPFVHHHPMVFGRYLLVTLPIVLLWVALGVERLTVFIERRLPAAPRLAIAVPMAVVAALVAGGPLADRAYWTSSFVHHNDLVGFHRSAGTLPIGSVPAFYRTQELRGSTLIEFPWSSWWEFSKAVRIYQEVHGARVIVGATDPVIYGEHLAFRNAVAPSPKAFLASDADFVVVHLDPLAEEARIVEPDGSLGAEIPPAYADQFREALRDEAGSMARRLNERWGPPQYADADIRVWSLARVRQRSGGRAP